MMRRFFLSVVFLFAILNGSYAGLPLPAFAEELPTICVMNFSNRAADEWNWLSKGLADMLITDLSLSGKFRVVERERMQLMFDEMGLVNAGIINEQTAQQFGKVTQVKWALFGMYLRNSDGQIEIECHIVEVATRQLRRVEWVRGPDSEVLKLEKQLALQIADNFNFPLAKEEQETLLRMSTRSIDAAKSYYGAIDKYDAGDYTAALTFFKEALKFDTTFAGARLRVGQMFYDLGEPEHALLEFRRASKGALDNDSASVAEFISAEIEQYYLNCPELAVAYYSQMSERHFGSPLAVVASFRAAQIYEAQKKLKDAYKAYAFTERLYNEALKESTRLHSWSGLLTADLESYSRIARERNDAYFMKWYLAGDLSVEAPENFIFLSEDQKVFIAKKSGTYVVFAPGGHFISRLFSNREIYIVDFSTNAAVGEIEYKNKELISTNFSPPCGAISLSLNKDDKLEFEFSASSRAILAQLNKELDESLRTKYVMPGILDISAYRDGAGIIYSLVTESNQISAQGVQRRSQITDRARLKQDIWIAQGKFQMGPLRKMRVNSLRQDYHSCLTQDKNGKYWLAFCSRRKEKKGVNIWLSSSMDCRHWAYPRKINLDLEGEKKTIDSSDDYGLDYLTHPQIMIDKRGLFWLAFKMGGNIYITNSEDSWEWKKPVEVGICSSGEVSIGLCDGREDKVVVAFTGVAIAEVAPDLSFEKQDTGKDDVVRPKYGWYAQDWKGIQIFRMPDSRFLLFGAGNYQDKYGLYACISDDLIQWKYYNLLDWQRYKLPPNVYKSGLFAVIPLFDEESIFLISVKPTGILVQKLFLKYIMGKERRQE